MYDTSRYAAKTKMYSGISQTLTEEKTNWENDSSSERMEIWKSCLQSDSGYEI